MAKQSAIEWTDSTANFWIGCTKDGQGCVNCYAEADWDKRKHRVQWGPRGDRSQVKAGPLLVAKLHRAASANGGVDPELGRRRRVFVNSLSDSFDDHQSIRWRDAMLYTLEQCRTLDVLLLTKRIENVAEMVPPFWRGQWPAHVALGISLPTQKEVDEDLPRLVALKRSHGITRIFLSIEPLLERVVIPDELMAEVDWVIVGGESGRHPRLLDPYAVRALRDQCQRLNIPFLFKQWGEWGPVTGSARAGDIMVKRDNEFITEGVLMRLVGKKAAGRELDGRTWTEFPREKEVAR